VLSVYNALSYRLEGSFKRKVNTSAFGFLTARLNYTGYTTVQMQVIGWEYDLASRVARITFGQVPTAYVYPIS
jgi:YD repeat-containing protein